MNIPVFIIVLAVYLLMTIFLGYLGWKNTRNAADFMVGGRRTHPYIMAISYGATFISTSAIVGFGGQAANLGLGLLWLTFLNILFGIFIAFIVFGKKTRLVGHNLDAHTFPELLGKRYGSRAIQRIGGIIIFVFMPMYASAVLIGAARFIDTTLKIKPFLNMPGYFWALIIYTVIIAIYVFAGGIKGVMYTDTLQGTIMLAGMAALLILTYVKLGGFISAHQALTNLASMMPEKLVAAGAQGWTTMPVMGSSLWWTLVSTIVLGVGIGVLAQPQLAVRFMMVKSSKELNRAVLIGGIFILMMTGVAFIVGALSNVFFVNETGKIALANVKDANVDLIIPEFINRTMPPWFVYLFMITLLSAAMSTSSGQFHAMGTSFGRDIFSKSRYSADYKEDKSKKGLVSSKVGIIIGILLGFALGYFLPGSIIARATSLFFGVCAATFLPMYILGLFWRRANRAGALAGMITGIVTSMFWMLFIHEANSKMIKLVTVLTGKTSLLGAPWNGIDQIVIAFPLAFIVTLAVTLLTKPMPKDIIDKAYKKEEVQVQN